MSFDLIDAIMFFMILFMVWTIFFGAILMDIFENQAMFIGAIFIGLIILEIITITKFIEGFENATPMS